MDFISGIRRRSNNNNILESSSILLTKKRYYCISDFHKRNKKFRNKAKILSVRNNQFENGNYYSWVEHLILTPIPNYRKLVIDLILAHYLINVRKLSYEESYTIIKNWLDRCDKLENLDNYRNFEYRIKYALKNAVNKGIGPMSKEKIKTDSTYSELYQLLKKEKVLL